MSHRRSTRRDFLKTVGVAAGAGAFALRLPPDLLAQPSTVRVRKDVSKLDPNGPEIKALKKAVMVMKQRAKTDKTSWYAQAKIHNDHCTHSNWFFLPWHRPYLLYFEKIARQASGDPSFTLPYWNWTANPKVPAAFWGNGNPLFDSTRQIGPNDAASAEFVGQTVIDNLLKIPDFVTFGSKPAYKNCSAPPLAQRATCGYGQLEGTPHNYIHGWIGGDMGTYWSPLDPIFWLHHANIDRLWTEWNKKHANTDDPGWLGFTFPKNFYDIHGQPVSVKVNQVLDTYALGYRYDTQPAAKVTLLHAAAALALEGSFATEIANAKPVTAGAALSVTLQPPAELKNRIRSFAAAAPAAPARSALRLEVGKIAPPKTSPAVRVFLNLPSASASTPISDPHYVGSFTFFEEGPVRAGEEAHVHEGEGDRTFVEDLSVAVAKLAHAKSFDANAPLHIQLVTVPLEHGREVPAITPKKFKLSAVG